MVEGSRLGYSSQRPTCLRRRELSSWNGSGSLRLTHPCGFDYRGMAFGRVDTKFPAGYKVYPLRPGFTIL